MGEALYQIIVTGELLDGTYLPDVKVKLAALFNTPADKLDPLFSGKRVVIKKGLGEDDAKKYVAAVQGTGLRCAAELLGAAPAPAPAAAPPQETKAATQATSPEPMAGVSLAPAGATLVEAAKVEAPSIDTSAFSVAPVGETLVESPPVAVPDIDISALSAAPVGGNLVEHTPPPAPAIDTSAFTVAPPGSQLVEAPTVDAADIDTSNLDMAPVGSDMGEAKRADAPPPPDVSHIKLDS